MKSKATCLVGFLLLLMCSSYWLLQHKWQHPFKVPIQRKIKLLTINNENTVHSITIPRSIGLSLVLASPSKNVDPFMLGDVGVSVWQDQQLVLAQTYTKSSSQECNWLDEYGLQGFFLANLEDESPAIKASCLRSNAVFRIAISNAVIGSTVWIKSRHLSGWDYQ